MRGHVNRKRRLSEKGKRLFRDSTLPEPSLIVLTARNKRCVRCSVLNTSNDIVSSSYSLYPSLYLSVSRSRVHSRQVRVKIANQAYPQKKKTFSSKLFKNKKKMMMGGKNVEMWRILPRYV